MGSALDDEVGKDGDERDAVGETQIPLLEPTKIARVVVVKEDQHDVGSHTQDLMR